MVHLLRLTPFRSKYLRFPLELFVILKSLDNIIAKLDHIFYEFHLLLMKCHHDTFPTPFRPNAAVAGDVLVLTKPLGTQVACNAYQWLQQKSEKWNRVKMICTEEDVEKAYNDAMFSMSRLNRTGTFPLH